LGCLYVCVGARKKETELKIAQTDTTERDFIPTTHTHTHKHKRRAVTLYNVNVSFIPQSLSWLSMRLHL